MNALEFANARENVIVRYASQGSPAGRDIALLDETALPFDLLQVEGEIGPDGVFEATNLNPVGGAWGWQFTDWNCNIIYGLWLRVDAERWQADAREYQNA